MTLTLTEMREHAKVALARKPLPLDLELLARDVEILCDRVEELAASVEAPLPTDEAVRYFQRLEGLPEEPSSKVSA
jgi:hypothetical protein